MADMPDSTGGSPTSGTLGVSSSVEGTVPAWLAARRARVPSVAASAPEVPAAESDLDIEFSSISEEAVSASEDDTVKIDAADSDLKIRPTVAPPGGTRSARPCPVPAIPPPLPSVIPDFKSSPVVAKPKSKVQQPPDPVLVRPHDDSEPLDNSLKARLLRFVRSATVTGVLVSMLVHTIVLSVLAVLVIGGPSVHQALDIFGVMADPSNNALSEIELDSIMPIDPGPEAAPLEFPDVSQLVNSEQAAFDPSESIRGLPGGTGKGAGAGGEGEGMSVAPLKIPGHAVTKGSFSAWTEPKDPLPGISYEIIIQFRLPANVKTYRGNDLTGMVIGTDGYKQVIRFRRDESFPVQDGSVQVRIRVPGADRLVRDTIRIESKLLREKQMIEIEF